MWIMKYRQELVVALGGLVRQFETQFAAVAYQCLEEERQASSPIVSAVAPGGWNVVTAQNNGNPDLLIRYSHNHEIPHCERSFWKPGY